MRCLQWWKQPEVEMSFFALSGKGWQEEGVQNEAGRAPGVNTKSTSGALEKETTKEQRSEKRPL
jgi:hypothetical protein